MSVDIKIRDAIKRYGNNTIIGDLSLDVKVGEFFTLLGPSGCGKTTLLRMIAGFNSIEGGDFYFNDKRINDIDPAKRNIGMVFQNYAIFPHLTVKDNVAFGLKNKKVSKDDIEKETAHFMELMHIDKYADRLPERLSGGQQQRVALARALVIKPDVLLMDEPLSNLDAKLRVEMRTVIKQIQHEVGITTVYVTHDQEEAMAVSDRIAVMKDGGIQHIGTPKNIYQRPANLFVSTFIGRTNILKACLQMRDERCYLKLSEDYIIPLDHVKPEEKKDREVIVTVRPEEFVINVGKTEGLKAVVDESIFLGLNTHYRVHCDNQDEMEIIQESEIDSIIEKGTEICLTVKSEKINVFSEDGSRNLLIGVQNDGEIYLNMSKE